MKVKDDHIIDIFKKRDGQPTIVKLNNGKQYTVWDIAWGYDMGDEFAHITTNVSPGVEGASVDFFYTSEIIEISESKLAEALYKT